MPRVAVNGIELEAQVIGTGEPVLLIPNMPSVYAPLLKQPALADGYRLIDYHRRNTGGSTFDTEPPSDALHAADARALLRHFGVERAHVVGHSFGGAIAIQLALDYPEAIHSLVLMEPAQMPVSSAAEFRASLAREEAGGARYQDLFLDTVLGPEGRQAYDRELPGWVEQQVVIREWQQHWPAVQLELHFSEEVARRITQPVLTVLGANSIPMFRDGHELLLKWLPQVEAFVLPDANHALQVMNPRGMAEALAGFFARHPMK